MQIWIVLGIPWHTVTKPKNWIGHSYRKVLLKIHHLQDVPHQNAWPLSHRDKTHRHQKIKKKRIIRMQKCFAIALCSLSHFIMARSPFPPTERQIFKIASWEYYQWHAQQKFPCFWKIGILSTVQIFFFCY